MVTMSFAMWGKALRGIPRINKEEWARLDIIARWLIATRSAVLIMTFISSAIAGILALRDSKFDLLLWVMLTAGLVMAHATNNILNDITDSAKGVDKDNYFRTQYGAQPLEAGLLTRRQIWVYAIVTGLIALSAGAYLVYLRGPLAVVLLGLGAFFVLFYTWPLKYIGLGEVAVVIVWGPLMIGGGYYIITGDWNWNIVLAGLPYVLGPTTVIFGKHIDKFVSDKAKRIHTLPVLLGERNARYAVLGMIALQYLSTLYLVVTGSFTPVMLIVLVALTTLPKVWHLYRRPKPETMPADYRADVWPLWFSAVAFVHNRRFGLLFLLGLIGEVVLRQIRF